MSALRGLHQAARRASTRAVNALMTATYWRIGRRIAAQSSSLRAYCAPFFEALRVGPSNSHKYGGLAFRTIGLPA